MVKRKSQPLLYRGPVSSLGERPLVPGTVYDDLPAGDPIVANGMAAKLLVTPPDASPEPKMPDSTSVEAGDDRSTKGEPS